LGYTPVDLFQRFPHEDTATQNSHIADNH